MITIEEVEARVRMVESRKDDNESAHGIEDDLYEDVLRAIAEGSPEATALARAALKSKDVDFARWCA